MTKFTYTVSIKEGNEWQTLHGWVRPFSDVKTLDESLDTGHLKLSCIRRKEPIKPFTPMRIEIQQERSKTGETTHQTMYYICMSNSVVQRSFAFPDNLMELYDHDVNFIELTKLLEREICDSLTFTNYLGHDFLSGAGIVQPTYSEKEASGIFGMYMPQSLVNNINYAAPISYGNNIQVVSAQNGFSLSRPAGASLNFIEEESSLRVTYPNKATETYAFTNSPTIAITQEGNYILEYNLRIRAQTTGGGPMGIGTAVITYTLLSLKSRASKPSWTITDCINRILSAGRTRRKGIEKQRYRLDPAVAKKYSTVLAPEFYITKSTLFEALMTVGGYIHAIPRLLWNEAEDAPNIVTFDELGGSTERVITQPLIGYDIEQDMDEYCGQIDSHVDNLLNSRDLNQGSIVEPYENGFKTVRCEEGGIEIKDDTALILTAHPIHRIVKLEMGYINETDKVGDITPYVYEEAEYGTLSSYGGQYPYSKAFALVYRQGDNKIKGLNFKLENVMGGAWEKYAIKNIAEKKGYGAFPPQLKNLAFRVTYIPDINARITQRKPYVGDFPLNNTLIYNQSANTVEAEVYGENLKGNIAKLGNPVEHRSYYFIRMEDIPKCGELVDGKYVSQVRCEYERIFIRATITLTPNFNRVAQYLALNSNYRLFDVSEKQSIERYVNYSENLIIGDKVGGSFEPILREDGMQAVLRTLTQDSEGDKTITCAVVSGENESGSVEQTQVCLPVIGMGLGNSIAFIFKFQDNFSAGYCATYCNNTGAQGTWKNVQQTVPYADVYGELYHLNVRMANEGTNIIWEDQEPTPSYDGYANMFPRVDEIFDNFLMGTDTHPLIIQKDSRENLNITYQLHFIANRKSIVVGSAFTQNNLLVTKQNGAKKGQLYLLPYKLNMLNATVDLTGATRAVIDISAVLDLQNNKIASFQNTTNKTFESWAIVDPITGRLYVGENVRLSPGERSQEVWFNFTDNSIEV